MLIEKGGLFFQLELATMCKVGTSVFCLVVFVSMALPSAIMAKPSITIKEAKGVGDHIEAKGTYDDGGNINSGILLEVEINGKWEKLKEQTVTQAIKLDGESTWLTGPKNKHEPLKKGKYKIRATLMIVDGNGKKQEINSKPVEVEIPGL